MVSKELKSALNKAVNENLKFVAVRLADCKPPAILTDALYIDLYRKGLEDAMYHSVEGGIRNSIKGQIIDLKMSTVRLDRPLTLKNSMKVTIKSKSVVTLKFVGIMQVLFETQLKPIKMLSRMVV